MDDCETTRKQVLDLRVLELKDVLDYVEINAEGSKKALQERVMEIIQADVFKLKSYISQITSLRLRGKSRKYHSTESQTSKRSRSVMRMDSMPLYDFHSDTIITTALIPSYKENSAVEVLEVSPEFSTKFDLLGTQKDLIFGQSGRVPLPSSKARIFLRIGVDLDQLQIADEFPAGINITVNGRHVPLPDVLPSKPNHLTRRYPKPVDITDFLVGGIRRNLLSITWSESETRKFIVSVFCGVRVETSELIRRLRCKRSVDESTTIDFVRKFYEPNEEFLSVSECIVSLSCPGSKTRLRNPARGRTCNHVQCFDAETYVQLNEKRPKWNCLVCGARAYFCDLRIDKFFDKILSSNKLSPDATSVVIDKAGNWEEDKKHRAPAAPSAAIKRPKTSESEVISLSSEDEGEKSPPQKIPRLHNSYKSPPFNFSPLPFRLPSCDASSIDEEIITID